MSLPSGGWWCGELSARRARRSFSEINEGISDTAWLMSMLAAIAVMLTGIGVVLIRRAVARPLAEITRITEQVAEGAAVAIPYGSRRDEIGALSRSIAVFQHAMRHNADLNRTVVQDAEARARHQEQVSCEIT